jgi:DNA-binding NarL/FixJ family response regulator
MNCAAPAPIEVAIIEDEDEVREGLAMLINRTDDLRCCERFRSMEDALREMGGRPVRVALVDIGLPGMSGIEGIALLKARFPDLLVLILTVYKDDNRIFDAIYAGAHGYLLKTTPPERLLESLREVNAGGAPMSPAVARRVVELFRQSRPQRHAGCHLSAQETSLLKLLCEGHHYKTAAAEMNISIHTVNFHLRNIYSKLHVHSMSEAVAKALREKLMS